MAEYSPPSCKTKSHWTADFYPEASEILDIMGGKNGSAIAEAMRKLLSSRPYTLIHGDLRCDNIFNPKS